MAHPHHAHREHHAGRARAKHILGHKRGGRAHHSDEAADRKLFSKMIKEHEHKVSGHKSGGRLDKYARGGATKHGKHHTQVNIAVVAPHRGSPSPGAGAPPGAGAALPPPPPGGLKPPIGMPPGAGPGGPPMPPPGGGMMKRGGRAYARGGAAKMTAGAESGEGRLQKAKAIKKH